MAATEELLGLIHEATANQMLARLRSGEPLSPQELSVIVKFLKDNGVEALPTANNKLGRIADALPDFSDEEPLHARH